MTPKEKKSAKLAAKADSARVYAEMHPNSWDAQQNYKAALNKWIDSLK